VKNGIYFYQAPFPEYIKYGSGKIAELPAKETDIFGCVTFVFDQKEGFLQSNEGKCLLKKLLKHCLHVELDEKMLNRTPDDPHYSLWSGFSAFPKNDKIKSALQDYHKYVLDVKKYRIISRHRTIEPPEPPFLARFFGSVALEFTPEAYEFFMENTHFIVRKTYSEKHGYSAGVYEFGYRGENICNLEFIREILNEYECFEIKDVLDPTNKCNLLKA